MTEIQKKPAISGAIGTAIVWILMLIFFSLASTFLKPKEFKTIQIRLDAPAQKTEKAQKTQEKQSSQKVEQQQSQSEVQPVQKIQETSPAKSAASEAKTSQSAPEQTKAAPSKQTATKKADAPKKAAPAKPAEQPKQTSQPAKTAPAKSEPKPVEQVLQKSIDELMAEQQAKKTVKKEVDWDSMFGDADEKTSSASTSTAKTASNSVNSGNALSGSAASAATNTSTAASSSSTSARSNNSSTSSSTSSALSKIAATSYSSSTGSVSSNVTANTGSSANGKTTMQMSDGIPRELLEPESPKITLSLAAAALIDSTKRLEVTFTVAASGNVLLNSIKISPDILPGLVSSEIKQQISSWRFASAPYEGSATFRYTIQKN